MTTDEIIEALRRLCVRDKHKIYARLRADRGLMAYASVQADIERSNRGRREREIIKRAAQGRRTRDQSRLRAQTAEEILEQ